MALLYLYRIIQSHCSIQYNPIQSISSSKIISTSSLFNTEFHFYFQVVQNPHCSNCWQYSALSERNTTTHRSKKLSKMTAEAWLAKKRKLIELNKGSDENTTPVKTLGIKRQNNATNSFVKKKKKGYASQFCLCSTGT